MQNTVQRPWGCPELGSLDGLAARKGWKGWCLCHRRSMGFQGAAGSREACRQGGLVRAPKIACLSPVLSPCPSPEPWGRRDSGSPSAASALPWPGKGGCFCSHPPRGP